MNETFLKFSAPFIKSSKETFKLMMHTEVTMHSPKLKTDTVSTGDITAIIGMNGSVENTEGPKDFKGVLAISFPEPIYVKLAGRMLGEEYSEYTADISDVGAELANIILGAAKPGLSALGIKLDMTSPSTVRGKHHEISFPRGSTIVETTMSCDLGDFFLDICYQDLKLK